MKVYLSTGPASDAFWLTGNGHQDVVTSIDKADVVLFSGGVDVDPSLYHEPRHPMTQESNSHRDLIDCQNFQFARKAGKPMVGICRGGQFLCVMAGGRLVQHQRNGGSHHIIAKCPYLDVGQPRNLYVTSDHHQAQYPWGIPVEDWKLLGWTYDESKYHLGGNGEEMVNGMNEVEDVYYRKIRALAIQSHPEWQDEDEPAVAHYRKLVQMLVDNTL